MDNVDARLNESKCSSWCQKEEKRMSAGGLEQIHATPNKERGMKERGSIFSCLGRGLGEQRVGGSIDESFGDCEVWVNMVFADVGDVGEDVFPASMELEICMEESVSGLTSRKNALASCPRERTYRSLEENGLFALDEPADEEDVDAFEVKSDERACSVLGAVFRLLAVFLTAGRTALILADVCDERLLNAFVALEEIEEYD